MATDEKDEGFLARWSRLKSAPEAPVPAAPPEETGAAGEKAVAPEPRKEKIDPAELPPLESLTAESDFTVFLRDGVPDALRRQALKKLWVSDPVIAATDVLDVYNLDYFNMPSFPDGVKTLFRVGRGMIDEDELAAEKKAAEEAAKQAAESGAQSGPLLPSDSAADIAAEDAAAQHEADDSLSKAPVKRSES